MSTEGMYPDKITDNEHSVKTVVERLLRNADLFSTGIPSIPQTGNDILDLPPTEEQLSTRNRMRDILTERLTQVDDGVDYEAMAVVMVASDGNPYCSWTGVAKQPILPLHLMVLALRIIGIATRPEVEYMISKSHGHDDNNR